MVVLAASSSLGSWAAVANVVVLGLVGAAVTVVSLLPLAMANDDPGCGPLVRSGIGQVITLVGLIASVVGGVWVAEVATTSTGWAAIGWALGGWVTWAGGYVVSVGLLLAMARLGGRRP
jgi:hypothetical protein